MWAWLQGLSGGAATFVGSLTGSAIGLIALLIGALFNAHLNRRRDDALRKSDVQSVAAALQAELALLENILVNNANTLDEGSWHYYTPDLTHSVRVMPQVLGKFGLLDVETIKLVLTSYAMVEQYSQNLILMGGVLNNDAPKDRRLILMDRSTTKNVATMNRNTALHIKKAISRLESL